MIIANPIYDVVFKSLMADLDIARGLISGLIGREVLSLETRTSDVSLRAPDACHAVTVYRLDYVAELAMADGSRHRALIEVQKARLGSEVRRFREYLGRQYQSPTLETNADGRERRTDPPLITIYILGFDLDERVPPYAKVDRRIIDLLTGQPAHAADAVREPFIEGLTHDMFVLQTRRIGHEARNELERLLAVFAQRDFVGRERQHFIDFPDELSRQKNRLLQRILRHLHRLSREQQTQDEMETEDASYREFEQLLEQQRRDLEQQRDQALQRAEAEHQRAEEERQRAEEHHRRAAIAEHEREQERQRAANAEHEREQERQRAEEERQRAEEERQRAGQLQAELEALRRRLDRNGH